MKRFIFIVLLLMLLASSLIKVVAQSETVAATPTQASKQKQIDDLKERLATKVAELRNVQRKAIAGKVKSQTVSTMTIETPTKDIKIELIDTIKVFQNLKGTRTTLTTDNVDNGDHVAIFGEYDTTLDVLKAKVIFIDDTPTPARVSGIVTNMDKIDFTLTLQSLENISYTIDVESSTKTSSYTKEGGVAKSGFSKINIGDTVHVVGTKIPKKDNQITAKRLLDLGNVIPESAIPSLSPTPEPSVSPTATAKPTKATTPKPSLRPTESPAP